MRSLGATNAADAALACVTGLPYTARVHGPATQHAFTASKGRGCPTQHAFTASKGRRPTPGGRLTTDTQLACAARDHGLRRPANWRLGRSARVGRAANAA
eukprot:CAMPEP_0114544642 /NCGR_PEP_ID=MMETSP0114-20121206/2983_1 /TAXON_ID=31324 /ORGANISM="Goniomonas sp, Strain m" /LENGTH=99 /DNA_ID=CAMNT_0001729031 /DNA_START=160 /DNA_END=457 /DNA_ORIENTATION=+